MPLARWFTTLARLLSAAALLVCASSLSAQSVAGRWEGITKVQGGVRVVTLTLDSAGTAWRGSLLIPTFKREPIPLAAAQVHGETVALQLPSELGALLRGALSADHSRLDGLVLAGGDTGMFHFARAGTAALAKILADAKVGQARSASHAKGRPPQQHPDSALLVTADIDRFWRAVERAPADSLEAYLQRDYLDSGSAGVQEFIPGRILGAGELAYEVTKHRDRYDAARPNMRRIAEATSGIRAVYHTLASLYPAAKFPDVYFIVGRFNSGGTSTAAGLLIGAEMIRDVGGLPSLVAHELIHFQQPDTHNRTLLSQTFLEGAADFVGELISHGNINSEKYKYGYEHEHELWAEFSQQMHGTNTFDWLYRKPPGDRPNDMGYFVGYRIAKSYYEKAADKRLALREIIEARDVDAILRGSGYAP